MRRFALLGLAGVGLVLSGTTCPRKPPNTTQRVAGLQGFSSPEELRAYLAEQATVSIQGTRDYGFPLFGALPFLADSTVAPPAVPTATGDQASSEGGNSAPADPFSTTNIQEAGVDESDIVKNDGQTIFALDGDVIHIVKANPAQELAEVATISVESSGDSLYLKGTTLIALSRQYAYYYYGPFEGGPVGVGVATPPIEPTRVATADAPVSSVSVEGSSGSSGSGSVSSSGGSSSVSGDVGSTTVIEPPIFNNEPHATATIIDVSDPAHPTVKATIKFQGDLVDTRLIGNKLHVVLSTYPSLPPDPTPLALEARPLEEWIPDFELRGGDGSVVQSGDVVSWDGFFRPVSPSGYGIVTVVTLNVDTPTEPFASTAITANTGLIYASPDALYLTDTKYDYETGAQHEDTIIHKLAFTETGSDYVASGIVPGLPLNQYSLGEFEGNLRIATNINSFTFASSTTSNSVYVLGESGTTLAVLGKIENIASGEQIYAARFIGERGFLVTFRRIDPLFTLDLSDPTNPRVAGKLKVPGYSDHIQLLDENHLLTIGKDAQDNGSFAWVQGVQLSIFDVTDLANPQLLHKETIGGRGTSSDANYNPKAFNYFAAMNALAFPIDLYSGDTTGPEYGDHSFTGLYVYRVTVAGGFEFLGRIETSEGQTNDGCYFGYYGYTRGVFIGNNVYSVTQNDVRAASLDDVASIVGQADFADTAPPQKDCFFADPVLILPVDGGLE